MSSKAAIQVSNLSKCYHIYDRPQDRLIQMITLGRDRRYREFWALRDVSFEIGKGETVAIIGRNGSGKSTLLQMICGTVNPTHGSVVTHGRVAALLELGSGFNPEFTGRENVYLNASVIGLTREEIDARFGDIAAFAAIGEFIEQPVKTYSSGMYARLAFAIAIHADPDILIVDETLSVGDARFTAKCMRRIKDIQSRGATILFVSHDVTSVRTLCERAIWLDRGTLIENGDVFPITGRYMEYLFRDEDTAPDANVTERPLDQVEQASDESPASNEAALGVPAAPALDAKPVTHWGSHRGTIRAAGVRDSKGVRKDVFHWAEEMEVFVEVCVPASIPREHLSVAFSIKDLKGTDLVVSTTYDFGGTRLPADESFTVSFRLKNQLVFGKYLLVAAVEDRRARDIHYYEYIEGAHYFSCVSEQRFFGIFQPPIQQSVEIVATS